MRAASTTTSGGASAGDATKSRAGFLRAGVQSDATMLGETNVPDELPGQPQEWLFEVIVGLRGDLEVLQVLLPVERHSTSLDFALLFKGSVNI